MLAAYLVRMIELHAEKLTNELVDDLLSNARTPSFHQLSRTELHDRAYKIYRHLGDWLGDRSDEALNERFIAQGRQRFHENVPLAELVYAIVLTKEHVRARVRSVGSLYSSLELHNEIELNAAIGRFFDRMLYAIVSGYETARREHEHPRPVMHGRPTGEMPRTQLDWLP